MCVCVCNYSFQFHLQGDFFSVSEDDANPDCQVKARQTVLCKMCKERVLVFYEWLADPDSPNNFVRHPLNHHHHCFHPDFLYIKLNK